MNVLVWNVLSPQPMINQFHHHTEFVTALDFSLFYPKQMLSAGWDKRVTVYDYDSTFKL